MIIDVHTDQTRYPIHIGAGLLERVGELCREVLPGRKILVVSNETVGQIYGGVVVKSVRQAGYDVYYKTVPDGEAYKDLHTLSLIFDACVEAELDRSSALIAVGGGVVCDMVGFAAASYMRGIRFAAVPTTLLAQVDASVGGKTGVNHPAGKNLIGAFHQPSLVVIDPETLVTLPRREFVAGMAEVVKSGLIADPDLFRFCEEAWDKLLALDEDALVYAIATSVQIKKNVVEVDERESGLRAILNFGHSVGHAIEAATSYQRFSHGEAVALGMIAEGWISLDLGCLSLEELDRIGSLIGKLGLPRRLDGVAQDEILSAMRKDKKNRDGRLTLALLDGIGRAQIVPGVEEDRVEAALSQILVKDR